MKASNNAAIKKIVEKFKTTGSVLRKIGYTRIALPEVEKARIRVKKLNLKNSSLSVKKISDEVGTSVSFSRSFERLISFSKTFDTGLPKKGLFCEMVLYQALVNGKPDHNG